MSYGSTGRATGRSRLHNVMDTHRSRILEETGSKLVTCSVDVVLRRRSNLVQPTRAPGATKGATRGLAFVSSLGSLTKAKSGGADRDRTDDLKLAKLPLSQLSYGPVGFFSTSPHPKCEGSLRPNLVGQPARFARRAQGFVSSLCLPTKPKCGGPGTS